MVAPVLVVIGIVFVRGCGVGVRLEAGEAAILAARLEYMVEEARLSLQSCGLELVLRIDCCMERVCIVSCPVGSSRGRSGNPGAYSFGFLLSARRRAAPS
jgi:hypothetical protein